MAIKKGINVWFCDNCGEKAAAVDKEITDVPRFCIHCMGSVGGAELNGETITFMAALIKQKSIGVKKGSSAFHVINDLRLKFARLFLLKIQNYERLIHAQPDGPSKNQQCKGLIEKLANYSQLIYPSMQHVDREE